MGENPGCKFDFYAASHDELISQQAYIPTIIRNWGVYIPTQLINFSIVPPHLRFVTVSIVSLFWSAFYLKYPTR